MATELTYRHVMPVQIRFSDVDQYGHMNNSSYFSIYDLAKTSYMRDVFGDKNWRDLGIVVANINADFLAPVFFSDDLYIETTVIHLGHKSFTLLQRAINKASGVLKCQCRTVMVGYDMATKEPVELPDSFKKTICGYEGKTLEELSKPL
ncbi:thioesterase family protein [Bacteroides sp. An322]|uniref:acyl-CoA thioesterase n=1 Tax=Bacteroides sp. An322 TaxID=1965632 RepID=UPI000B38D9FE|nr:thioesterase family protein [Bacteroides sp. An322]OUO19930.1 acyl-CoA thioester hydrolase [Bacteroides sp. An322]